MHQRKGNRSESLSGDALKDSQLNDGIDERQSEKLRRSVNKFAFQRICFGSTEHQGERLN